MLLARSAGMLGSVARDPVDFYMLQASSMMRPVAGRNPHLGRRSSQSSRAQMPTVPSRRALATVSV